MSHKKPKEPVLKNLPLLKQFYQESFINYMAEIPAEKCLIYDQSIESILNFIMDFDFWPDKCNLVGKIILKDLDEEP